MSGRQRLTLAGGYPDGLWSCTWCAAELASDVIAHKDGCRWVEEIRESERAAIRQQLTERAMEMGYFPNEIIFTVGLPHLGQALADLLADTPEVPEVRRERRD